MKFMTFWTDDWLAGTHPLTPEQRGVYITLIAHFVNKDRVVKDDDIYNARLSNCSTRTFRRIKKTLVEGDFIQVRDGHIWIVRTAQQYTKDQTYSKNQAVKAKLKSRFKHANILELNNSHSAPVLPTLPLPLPIEEKDNNKLLSKKIGASRMKGDWVPTEKGIQFALDQGYSHGVQMRNLIGSCRDHWLAATKNALKRDWNAAWRNWVRNDIKFNGDPRRRSGSTQPMTKGQIAT